MNKKNYFLLGAIVAAVAVLLLVKSSFTKTLPTPEPDERAVTAATTEIASSPVAPVTAKTPAVVQGNRTAAVVADVAATPRGQGEKPSQPDAAPAPGMDEPAFVPGEMAVARVELNGRTQELTPNQIGAFPKVHIEPGQLVNVTVAWPDGQPGERVVAAVEDGGELVGSGSRPLPLTLDGQRTTAFQFKAAMAEGIYRVTLRKSMTEIKTVQFWAGQELALRAGK